MTPPKRPHQINPSVQDARPTDNEAAEILEIARSGAAGAGASGAEIDDVAQIVAERFTIKWNEPHIARARSRARQAWHAYIAVAARNAHRDVRRAEHRRRIRERDAQPAAIGDAVGERPGVRRPTDHQPSDVDRYLGRRLVAGLIDECLQRRTRDVAMLVYVDGLSTREIADHLGLSVRTVNQHKLEATDRLKAVLEPGTKKERTD